MEYNLDELAKLSRAMLEEYRLGGPSDVVWNISVEKMKEICQLYWDGEYKLEFIECTDD